MKKQQPTPKKVPVSRVKYISDSLKYQEARKATGAYGLIMGKNSSPAQKKLGQETMNEAINDRRRADRLDSLVKKATTPKPIMKMKKTLTQMKKK